MGWKEFWNEFPLRFEKDSLFHQVGKTYGGKPINDWQFRILMGDIIAKLNITQEDYVLDLCCGNGLITHRIAPFCKGVSGIDFSVPLICTAEACCRAGNLKYHCASALQISRQHLFKEGSLFRRVYMYEALQHFAYEQLGPLLQRILTLSEDDVTILLASIPDRTRLTSFYNTPELLSDYYAKTEKGELLLGTWWDPDYIRQVCAEKGLRAVVCRQPAQLHTAYYRFDVLITRK